MVSRLQGEGLEQLSAARADGRPAGTWPSDSAEPSFCEGSLLPASSLPKQVPLCSGVAPSRTT